MTGQAAGCGDGIKVWSEAAHMAASLTLLQITSGVDLMHPQSKALLERVATLREPDLTD